MRVWVLEGVDRLQQRVSQAGQRQLERPAACGGGREQISPASTTTALNLCVNEGRGNWLG
jgi:hypothetical protein